MFSWKVVYGWMDKITKKERKYYLLMKCSVSTQKTLVRDVHAADVRYHLDCWLGVTKIQACWSGTIVTTISSILVWYKCNTQHRWFEIAMINMNAGQMQVYQTCMLVEASLTDMTSS